MTDTEIPTYPTNSDSVANAIRARQSFNTYGSLRGVRYNDVTTARNEAFSDSGYYSELSPADADALSNDMVLARNRGLTFYIVFSYSTPIAWTYGYYNRFMVVDHKFSATTSRHQRIVIRAVGLDNVIPV